APTQDVVAASLLRVLLQREARALGHGLAEAVGAGLEGAEARQRQHARDPAARAPARATSSPATSPREGATPARLPRSTMRVSSTAPGDRVRRGARPADPRARAAAGGRTRGAADVGGVEG